MFIQLHDDAYHIIRQSSIERKLELHRVQILSSGPFLPAKAIITSDWHPPFILYSDAALDLSALVWGDGPQFSQPSRSELWRGGWMDGWMDGWLWLIDRTMGSRVTTIDKKAYSFPSTSIVAAVPLWLIWLDWLDIWCFLAILNPERAVLVAAHETSERPLYE